MNLISNSNETKIIDIQIDLILLYFKTNNDVNSKKRLQKNYDQVII